MEAPTAEAQLAAAYDWYRSAARRHGTADHIRGVATVLAEHAAGLEAA